ncbi:MAG: hypothetical protein H6649_11000 [Caldilineae bacterium]|nr:hypothetical protein [Anaerolineae bacterium]MCB9154570.1 hypothetical protein [Caldilineae bacterium]
MNPYVDLYTSIAEISGIFVGFGALISVTRRSEVETNQLIRIRSVVTLGLVVVIAALLPVVLGSFGVTGHRLWFSSSLLFLALIWAVIALSLRRPENRALTAQQARSSPVMAAFFWILLEIPIQLPLLLVLLGLWPQQDMALYTTSLVFNLFQAAYVLAQLVYAEMSPPSV